jgi:hypothetical protein
MQQRQGSSVFLRKRRSHFRAAPRAPRSTPPPAHSRRGGNGVTAQVTLWPKRYQHLFNTIARTRVRIALPNCALAGRVRLDLLVQRFTLLRRRVSKPGLDPPAARKRHHRSRASENHALRGSACTPVCARILDVGWGGGGARCTPDLPR